MPIPHDTPVKTIKKLYITCS